MAKVNNEKVKSNSIEPLNMIKCPHCGFEFEHKLHCTRCGHEWIPRTDELPTVCPNPACKSPYWNKPYVKNGKNGKEVMKVRAKK